LAKAGPHYVFVRLSLLSLLTVAAVLFAADSRKPAPQPDALEKQFGLKPGPGRELVLGHCLPCHSTAIVAANHLKRERWAELIAEMQTRNGMRPIDEATRNRILDYLETAQRPDDAGLAAGKQSPWAAPLYRPNPIW
jgi:hypothetical protein